LATVGCCRLLLAVHACRPVPGNGLEDTFDKEAVLGEHSADREWSPEELAAATQDNVL